VNHHTWDDESLTDFYAETFNLPRQKRKPGKKPKNSQQKQAEKLAQIEQLADDVDLAVDFQTTYTPSRFEAQWLQEALKPFYELDLIVDVEAQVKGGKEANVYRCRANPNLGVTWLAAKVYRPRKLRNLRNDAAYREGRHILTSQDGGAKKVKAGDDQILRALGKSTEYGAQVQHTSWLMWEYQTLQSLHQAGASVPRAWAAAENGLIMDYVGDGERAAPTLHESHLERAEASRLFDTALENVRILLQNGLIHGDLSAYNILYWQGSLTFIDFPQIVQARHNRQAQTILRRDLARLVDYFRPYGIRANPRQIADALWQEYAALDPLELAADLSVFEAQMEESKGD
jgi:RIO kinase 1